MTAIVYELFHLRLPPSFPSLFPSRALCQERFTDWTGKFSSFGMRIGQVTGDTQDVELFQLDTLDLMYVKHDCELH